MGNLVSIIMAAFNTELYIAEAIDSVIKQEWQEWELLIVNDGSKDGTEAVIKRFHDKRIKYFEQANKGVSAARNVGLSKMNGDFFCFLDSDDVFPPDSLISRLEIFNKWSEVKFVDGCVEERSEDLKRILRKYTPAFQGNPLKELIKIRSSCFVGQTWMIRRNRQLTYGMPTDQSHGEDLFFFADLSRLGGEYRFTKETILLYRRRQGSARANLEALDKSYIQIFRKIKKWPEISNYDKFYFWLKSRKIMFLSYYFDGKKFWKALLSLGKV